jgi:precorrin-2/cobalt-factor-2 C20-methyltransferase
MKRGILYGVGVGPGDLDLITIKAVKILQKVDIIFTVVSRQSERSISSRVVDNLDNITAKRIPLTFAMTKDWDDREKLIKHNSQIVLKSLQEGKNCAFTTIGDPLTYSTYGYLMKEIQKLDSKIKIVTIPGVNSWSALAAASNMILVEDKEKLTIVPSYSEVSPTEALQNSDTVIFLKTYNSRNTIIEDIDSDNCKILYGSNIGMDKEYISTDKAEITAHGKEYLSMVIAKNNGTSD